MGPPATRVAPSRAGPRGRAALARLLLGTAGPGGIGLEDAQGVASERLQLTFRRTNGRHLIVHLKPVDAGGAYATTSHLGIAVEVDQVGRRLGAWLDRLAARLGERTLADLFALLEGDLHTTGDSDPGADSDGAPRTADPPAWSRFFDDALAHETWEPFFPDDSVARVEHADPECFFSHPQPHPDKWAFYNDPRLGPPASAPPASSPVPTTLVSELGEREVVLGSDQRTDRLLQAAAEAGEGCRVLVLNHLCTPVVLGEDLQGLASRLETASGRPVLQLTRHHKDRRDFLPTLLGLLGEAVTDEVLATNPDAVNLLGFPPGFRDAELGSWLAALGLEPNAVVLPEVTAANLARLGRAGLNLVCGDGLTTRHAGRWLKALPQPSVVVPAPYGLQGSRACLRAIAEAAHRPEGFEACWRAHFDPHARAWEQQRAAARGLRLGLVVNHRSWPLLAEPSGLSVPVIPLLTELGFDAEIFVAESDTLRRPAVASAAAGIAASGATVVCHAVTSAEDLRSALREHDCRAVYTDYGFDWRLSRAGVGQFSLCHFAPGVLGALESGQRLLELARLPFYHRYHRYLSPAAGGQP